MRDLSVYKKLIFILQKLCRALLDLVNKDVEVRWRVFGVILGDCENSIFVIRIGQIVYSISRP